MNQKYSTEAGDMPQTHFGTETAEKIRAESDFTKLTDYEKFILHNGYKYKTEKELEAGYYRLCKSEILTEDEFIAEAGENFETDTLREVYAVLAELAAHKKLTAGAVYRYAHFKWCLRNPEAIVACEESRNKWIVNTCDYEITEYEAKVRINGEWGFEAGRIKIIGTPYYCATDYHFIRFDCIHMSWLWNNGNLYQVYD